MRDKSTLLINLIGLSTGLGCVLLIYLWVNSEVRMDKFHAKDSQLYQVMLNLDVTQEILTLEDTPLPLGRALVEEIPEVKEAVSINDFSNCPSGDVNFSSPT
ncbi:MAG: ABC transporter permease [Bacteroidota bacterium]